MSEFRNPNLYVRSKTRTFVEISKEIHLRYRAKSKTRTSDILCPSFVMSEFSTWGIGPDRKLGHLGHILSEIFTNVRVFDHTYR